MTDDALYLMQVLADREDRRTGDKLASAMCKLVVDGAELGALAEREVMDRGVARVARTLPDEWFTRLADAVERGAFDLMSVEKIVERILLPPLPASASE